MGYLSAERVKEIRTQLKKEFTGFKFSVTRSHYSGVRIVILEAPIKMTDSAYVQVNEYYIESNYEGQAREILLRIRDIANNGVTYNETADYGTQPSFYIWINIGDWNKPFKYTGEQIQLGLPSNYLPQPQAI